MLHHAAAAAAVAAAALHLAVFKKSLVLVGCGGSYKRSQRALQIQQSHQEKTSGRMSTNSVVTRGDEELSDIISSEEETFLDSQMSSRDLEKAGLAVEEEKKKKSQVNIHLNTACQLVSLFILMQEAARSEGDRPNVRSTPEVASTETSEAGSREAVVHVVSPAAGGESPAKKVKQGAQSDEVYMIDKVKQAGK